MYYHCIVFFDVQNLILYLTRELELVKFIDYKIMLKLHFLLVKRHLILPLL